MPDTRSMLVELSVVEQRCQAVLAVIRNGVPVVEGSMDSQSIPSQQSRELGAAKDL